MSEPSIELIARQQAALIDRVAIVEHKLSIVIGMLTTIDGAVRGLAQQTLALVEGFDRIDGEEARP